MQDIFDNCDVSFVKKDLDDITSVTIKLINEKKEKNVYKIVNDLFSCKYVAFWFNLLNYSKKYV